MRRLLVLPLLCGVLSSDSPTATGRFALVVSVNNAGFIDVCGCKHKKVKQGSMSRRYTLVKTLRAQGKPILFLDGGSCLFNIQDRYPKQVERKQLLAKAFVIIESMNRMGYQGMALGSSDLLLGLENLKKLASAATFPILSANFLGPDGAPVFTPWTVVEAGGVRIGVIGLVMSTLNPRYLEDLAPGCRAVNAVETAKKAVAELKGKADLIVALSHVRKEENEELGKQVPEISLITDPNVKYGSHSLFLADPDQVVDRFGKALVVRTDGEGMRLTRIDVEFEVPFGELRTSAELNRLEKSVQINPIPEDMAAYLGRGNFNRAVVSRISVEPHYIADPGIETMIERWKKDDPGSLDPKSMAALKSAPITYVGKEQCVDCHKEQYEFWKTTDHAHAFTSLEETGDHLRYDCIGCHTVGFGHTFLSVKQAKKWADVQCECCHGSNPDHMDDPEGAGKWPRITEHTCLACHNEAQIRIPFDFRRTVKQVSCPKMEEQ